MGDLKVVVILGCCDSLAQVGEYRLRVYYTSLSCLESRFLRDHVILQLDLACYDLSEVGECHCDKSDLKRL